MSIAFKEGQELRFKGFPICPGIAIGRPFYFAPVDQDVPEFAVAEGEIEGEIARYYKALKHSQNDLLSLQERMRKEGGNEAVAILTSHLEMMHDPLMTSQIEEEIRAQGKNTEFAFKTVIREYEKKFCRSRKRLSGYLQKDHWTFTTKGSQIVGGDFYKSGCLCKRIDPFRYR